MAAAIRWPRKASHLQEIIRIVALLICVVVKQYNDNIQGWSTSKNFSNIHLYDIRFGAYPPRELKKSSSRVVSLRPRLYKCDNVLELSFHMYRADTYWSTCPFRWKLCTSPSNEVTCCANNKAHAPLSDVSLCNSLPYMHSRLVKFPIWTCSCLLFALPCQEWMWILCHV